METLYGEADRDRGLAPTVAWLCEEVGELAQAVRKGTPEQQLHELGDVLAWVASLANQLDLSLEEALQRYVTDPPYLSKVRSNELRALRRFGWCLRPHLYEGCLRREIMPTRFLSSRRYEYAPQGGGQCRPHLKE